MSIPRDGYVIDINVINIIICVSFKLIPPATLRLVGGSSKLEGRVEMQLNGQWGSVCVDQWDRDAATVVCRTLGLGLARDVIIDPVFGESNLTNVYKFDCQGFKTSILRCGQIGVNNCRYGRNAGVRCYEDILGKLQINVDRNK